MGSSATPGPPWQPDRPNHAVPSPGAGRAVLASRPAVASALASAVAAVLVAAGWWGLALATLGDARSDGRCSTEMPNGAATDALVPAHAVVAVLLLFAVAALAAARPAGPGRTARLVTLGVVALLSLLMLVPAEVGALVVVGATGLGVVLAPIGVAAAVTVLVRGRRGADASPSSARRVAAGEAVLWPALVSGPAASALWANLTFSNLFCF